MANPSLKIVKDISINPMTSRIGAEVTGMDISEDLPDSVIEQLRGALGKWKVLVFRNQNATESNHIAFGRRFGELTIAHPSSQRPAHIAYPEIYVVDINELKQTYEVFRPVSLTPTIFPPPQTAGWHTDITFVKNPAMGSILRAVKVPKAGGDTVFTNLVEAYKSLSPEIQNLLARLRAVHTYYKTGTAETVREMQFAAVHPMVRVHPETGERALFVNPGFTSHIVGLSRRESDSLLNLCFEIIRSEEFTMRVRWEPNTLVFWDNRATCHFGPVDKHDVSYERVMHRVTIKGDPPVGVDGLKSEQLVGNAF